MFFPCRIHCHGVPVLSGKPPESFPVLVCRQVAALCGRPSFIAKPGTGKLVPWQGDFLCIIDILPWLYHAFRLRCIVRSGSVPLIVRVKCNGILIFFPYRIIHKFLPGGTGKPLHRRPRLDGGNISAVCLHRVRFVRGPSKEGEPFPQVSTRREPGGFCEAKLHPLHGVRVGNLCGNPRIRPITVTVIGCKRNPVGNLFPCRIQRDVPTGGKLVYVFLFCIGNLAAPFCHRPAAEDKTSPPEAIFSKKERFGIINCPGCHAPRCCIAPAVIGMVADVITVFPPHRIIHMGFCRIEIRHGIPRLQFSPVGTVRVGLFRGIFVF